MVVTGGGATEARFRRRGRIGLRQGVRDSNSFRVLGVDLGEGFGNRFKNLCLLSDICRKSEHLNRGHMKSCIFKQL